MDVSGYVAEFDALRATMLLDDETALCTRETFGRLLDYTQSMPTGLYTGKIWRCRYGKRVGEGWRWIGWQLGECGETFFDDAGDERIHISWRELLVVA